MAQSNGSETNFVSAGWGGTWRAGARSRQGAPGAGGGRAEAGGPARDRRGCRRFLSPRQWRWSAGCSRCCLFFFSELCRYLGEERLWGSPGAPLWRRGPGGGAARGALPPLPSPLGCPGSRCSRRSSARGFVFPPAAGRAVAAGWGCRPPRAAEAALGPAVHLELYVGKSRGAELKMVFASSGFPAALSRSVPTAAWVIHGLQSFKAVPAQHGASLQDPVSRCVLPPPQQPVSFFSMFFFNNGARTTNDIVITSVPPVNLT
ncbi:uncharacterized protein LOC121097580 [Falco naumanni]|uniref:uncharacterized protein LOC121097580 n=1 Tax=Falco naumanni TaxID=148594 RepID=UPI001ADE89CD|nr:uncharacterized protein LOC121097580 [Falco naumanni]